MVKSTDSLVKELLFEWHERAQINHSELYMKLYVSYNAWYRRVTKTDFDSEALAALTKRFVIWDDYRKGRVLSELRPVARKIALATQHHPLQGGGWGGIVQNADDWRHLIYFWYQIRCNVFHGVTPRHASDIYLVELAYTSLNIFMNEIVRRMRACFSEDDALLLESQDVLSEAARQALYQKFVRSPQLWHVDMVRTATLMYDRVNIGEHHVSN